MKHIKSYIYHLLSFIPYFKRKMIEKNVEQLLLGLTDITGVTLKSKNLSKGSPINDLLFEINSKNGVYDLMMTYYTENKTLAFNVITKTQDVSISLDDIYGIKASILDVLK